MHVQITMVKVLGSIGDEITFKNIFLYLKFLDKNNFLTTQTKLQHSIHINIFTSQHKTH
jgi:hypothetical protein